MKFGNLLLLVFAVWTAVLMSGCATSIRGAKTDFIIQSGQEDLEILLDLETIESRKTHTWRARRDAVEKSLAVPDFEFVACEVLPCMLNIPRKHTFSVLAYKEGYTPTIYEISKIHKNEYKKLVEAGAVAGTAATVGGFTAVSATAWGSSATTSAGVASVAGPALLIGLPTMIFFIGSNEIDKSNRANYNFFPNPLTIELAPLAPNAPRITTDQVISQYKKQRINYALDPQRTGLCYYKNTRISCWRLKKLRKRLARANR